MKPSKLSLIRQAHRVDLPAAAWRARLDRWIQLGYSKRETPESLALRKGTVDSYLGFQFVRTPILSSSPSFRRRRPLPASFFRDEFARHFDRPLIGNVRVPRRSTIAGIQPRW